MQIVNMSFELLRNRKIIDVLIGDTKVYQEYRMPYHSGPQLCELSRLFGLSQSYSWGGGSMSRWQYMDELLEFVNNTGKTNELLTYLFDFARFDSLELKGTVQQIKAIYNDIVTGALNTINGHLVFSGYELVVLHNHFLLKRSGDDVIVEAPKVRIVTYQYIQELPERIKDDLKNKDFDSVVTKSRTLLEEVFIYIIEKSTKERYSSKGNIQTIYAEVKDLLNMRQQNDWDKRVNDMIGGINKIIDAIGSMRNMNSDAHGVGVGRLTIKEREARMIASSAIMVAEYVLSVFQQDRN
ncbi:MAG: abortive infection family protein [Paludibacteraceae bacterium]|nr:abortive infection family protein [Paludibacteraceae bacterium]